MLKKTLASLILIFVTMFSHGCTTIQSKTGFVNTDAGGIYYEERGSGPAMILIGGGGFVDLRQWDEAFDFFSRSYRVIRYDPLSTGRSDTAARAYSNAENLLVLMDSLRVRQAHLIGLSFGGEIALEFTLKYPGKVRGLVVSAPVVVGFERSDELKARVALFAQSMESGAESLTDALFSDPYFVPTVKNNERLAEKIKKLMIENYKETNIMPTAMERPMAEIVHQISVPTLIIIGDNDHPDIYRRMTFLHQKIKTSDLITVSNAGHLVNLENPKELNEHIVSFLNSIPRKSSGFVKVVSGNLFYEEKGTGYPVILIGRGAFMDSRQWEFAFEALSHDYRVIRYDPAGFGRSELPQFPYTNEDDLKVLCDSLKISKAVLVGVSFGGGIAMEFALKYPDQVAALVLSAPAVSGFEASPELQKQNEKFMSARSLGTESLIQVILEDDNFIPTAKKNKTLRERFQNIVRANQRKIDPALLIQKDVSLFEESQKIKVPVKLFIGEKDNSGLHQLTKELQTKMARASIKIVKDVGHVPHNETPEIFNGLIKIFIDDVTWLNK